MQPPLLLLVSAGRAPREIRLAVPEREPGTEGRPGSSARSERRRQAFLEPEHLRPRSQRPAEGRNGRGAVQPAPARGRGDHVPVAVDDVDVDGVAARGLPCPGHLLGGDERGEPAHPGLVVG